jgi:hypothetical protein
MNNYGIGKFLVKVMPRSSLCSAPPLGSDLLQMPIRNSFSLGSLQGTVLLSCLFLCQIDE